MVCFADNVTANFILRRSNRRKRDIMSDLHADRVSALMIQISVIITRRPIKPDYLMRLKNSILPRRALVM